MNEELSVDEDRWSLSKFHCNATGKPEQVAQKLCNFLVSGKCGLYDRWKLLNLNGGWYI